MQKKRTAKFTQHLLMFGDVFEPQITNWFGESFVIEHDVAKLTRYKDLYFSARAVSYATGTRYTKITEVISGNKKGRVFASMSGSFPVILDISKPQAKAILSKIYNLVSSVDGLDRGWENLDDDLLRVIYESMQLKKSPLISLHLNHKEIAHAVANFEQACVKLCMHNLRKVCI